MRLNRVRHGSLALGESGSGPVLVVMVRKPGSLGFSVLSFRLKWEKADHGKEETILLVRAGIGPVDGWRLHRSSRVRGHNRGDDNYV